MTVQEADCRKRWPKVLEERMQPEEERITREVDTAFGEPEYRVRLIWGRLVRFDYSPN